MTTGVGIRDSNVLLRSIIEQFWDTELSVAGADDFATPAAAAIAALNAAVDGIRALDVTALGDTDTRDVLVATHRAATALTGTGHSTINHLLEVDGLAELPGSAQAALASLLHISPADARAAISRAKNLGDTVTPTGHRVGPKLRHTAAAHRDGRISDKHVKIIEDFFKDLPSEVDDGTREHAEETLAAVAREQLPKGLADATARLAAYLNPDGNAPDDQNTDRKRSFTLDRQGPDGLTSGRFVATPELAALLKTLFDTYAAPGSCIPATDDSDDSATTDGRDSEGSGGESVSHSTTYDSDGTSDTDPDTGTPPDPAGPRPGAPDPRPGGGGAAVTPGAAAGRDPRTAGQRRHDAIATALRNVIGSGMLGIKAGVEARVIITMTLGQLEERTGLALTANGHLIPVADALRMAAQTNPYLLVTGTTGAPLYLGRTRRLASRDQRLALFATQRGCTFPGCTAPATWCEVHHTDEWALGGATDIDLLGLGCSSHHPLVGPGPNQWATTIAGPDHPYAGRVLWHPPALLDPTRTGRVNHAHHPEELLLMHEPDPPD